MMSERFNVLLAWWDRGSSLEFDTVVAEVKRILAEHHIRIRQDDGDLVQVNFSLPTSSESGLVLGLRYQKRDGTHTEDLFLCTQRPQGLDIVRYYRGRLERAFAEYLGTHKQQVDLATASSLPDGFKVDVRTITVTKGFK